MDFIKSCTTTVHSFDRFSRIFYKTLALDVNRSPVAHFNHDELRNNAQLRVQSRVYDAEVALRSQGALAASDTTSGCLWLFGFSEEDISEALLNSDVPLAGNGVVTSDISLSVVGTGDLQATDISFSLEDTKISAPENVQSPNSKAFHQNREAGAAFEHTQGRPRASSSPMNVERTRTITKMFLTAVVLSMQFQLSHTAGIIPITRRILAIRDTKMPQQVSPNPIHGARNTFTSCVGFDLRFTPNGYIYIATTAHPPMCNLEDMLYQKEARYASKMPGTILTLAPTGESARFVSIADVTYQGRLSGDPLRQRRNDEGMASRTLKHVEVRVWRQEVLKWLRTRGVSLNILELDSEWARVELQSLIEQREKLTAIAKKTKQLIIEWPLYLCLLPAKIDSQCNNDIDGPDLILASKDDGLGWFDTHDNNTSQSLITFAFDWLDQKPVRDKDIESKRIKREEDKDEEQRIYTASSPVFTRNLSSGDSHALNTIYLTPPDMIQAQTSSASFHDGSVISATIDTDLKAQSVSFTASPDNVSTYDDHQSLPTQIGINKSSNGKDAKFQTYNQSQVEVIDGDGITEDDFNFFDDADRVLDGTTVELSQDASQPQTFESEKAATAAPQGSKNTVEQRTEFGAQPTDELFEYALSSACATADNELSAQHQSLAPINTQSTASTSFSPTLTPAAVRQGMTLVPGETNKSVTSHHDAANTIPVGKPLGYVSFNPTHTTSDKKYRYNGRFGRSSPELNKVKTWRTPKRSLDQFSPVRWNQTNPFGTPKVEGSLLRQPSIFDLHKQEVDRMKEGSSSGSDSESSEATHSNTPASKYPRRDAQPRSKQTGVVKESLVESGVSEYPKEDSAHLLNFRRKAIRLLNQGFNQGDTISPRRNRSINQEAWSMPNRVLQRLLSIKSNDRFLIANIITAQATSPIYGRLVNFDGNAPREYLHETGNPGMKTLRNALNHILGANSRKDLVHLIKDCNQDIPTTQSNGSDNDSTSHDSDHDLNTEPLFSLPAPMVRVSKSDVLYDLLPSALSFWEALGLGPAHSAKDIWSYYVYPSKERLSADVNKFMTLMSSTYEDCKLGSQTPGPVPENYDDGHVPVHTNQPLDKSTAACAIAQSCAKLGKHLATTLRDDRPIIVFIINPFSHRRSLQILSTCFFALLQTYAKHSSRKPRNPSDRIFLQILPIGLVSSQCVPVLPSPIIFRMLSLGIYDRVKPMSSQSIEDRGTSAIELAEPLPEHVPFQTSAHPPRQLLHEDSCLHIAYSWSLDQRWMTVAWSDNIGQFQTTVSYMTDGMDNFSDVANEIWQTTLGVIQSKQVTWRIFLASVGHMHQEQQAVWYRLIKSTASAEKLQVTLVSTTPNPKLMVQPMHQASASTNPTSTITAPLAMSTPNMLTTPVSTPQTHTTSPTPNIASPGPEYITTPGPTGASTGVPAPSHSAASGSDDTSIRLIDITDESWGALLGEPLSVSDSPFEWRPALASGMLMKRGGSGDLDPLVLMEVSIIQIPAESKSRGGRDALPERTNNKEQKERDGEVAESILKELLVHYRALGLLARARGITHAVKSVLPWHIAVAKKGAEALTEWEVT